MAKNKSKKAKKTKKQLKWKIPEPTLNDCSELPDRSNHLVDLLKKFIIDETARRNKNLNLDPAAWEAAVAKESERVQNQHISIFTRYQNALRKYAGYPTTAELLKLDTIDMTRLSEDDTIEHFAETCGEQLQQYYESLPTPLYTVIPCFQKGLLIMNDNRRLYYEIKNLDPDGRYMRVFLRDFNVINAADPKHDEWDIGISGEVTFTPFLNGIKHGYNKIISHPQTFENFTNMYTKLSPHKVGFNEEEVNHWNKLVLQNAVDQAARFDYHGIDMLKELGRMFDACITTTNFLLSKFRPVIERKPKERKDEDLQVDDNAVIDTIQDKPVPEKRVRYVGTMKIISSQIPRRPTEKSIKKYLIESWTTRGHIRHLKSGRTVYVRPSVHHRQALKNKKAEKPVQQIIRLHETKTENDE